MSKKKSTEEKEGRKYLRRAECSNCYQKLIVTKFDYGIFRLACPKCKKIIYAILSPKFGLVQTECEVSIHSMEINSKGEPTV